MISGERAGEERESLVRILSNQKSTKVIAHVMYKLRNTLSGRRKK